MQKRRLIYQNWIVDLGFDPSTRVEMPAVDPWDDNSCEREQQNRESTLRIEELRKRVSDAVEKLDDSEREFIRQYYYLGFGYSHISSVTGRKTHKLEALHRRSIKRLRLFLSTFAESEYGIAVAANERCPICSSNACTQINSIITDRNKTETWRPVMNKIKEQCGLHLRSPQILIGHEKYHTKEME